MVKKLTNEHPVDEGNVFQTVDGGAMPLTGLRVDLKHATLHMNQFHLPSKYLIVGANLAKNYDADGEPDGTSHSRFRLIDGDVATLLINQGMPVEGIAPIKLDLPDPIPMQNFVANETFITLEKPNVLLNWDMGRKVYDGIRFVAEGVTVVGNVSDDA